MVSSSPAHRSLQHIGIRARLERSLCQHVTTIRRENDDARIRELPANRRQRIDAAHSRHLDVEQGDVRLHDPELTDGFDARGNLGHETHVTLPGDERADSFPQQRVVVYGEYADGARGSGVDVGDADLMAMFRVPTCPRSTAGFSW